MKPMPSCATAETRVCERPEERGNRRRRRSRPSCTKMVSGKRSEQAGSFGPLLRAGNGFSTKRSAANRHAFRSRARTVGAASVTSITVHPSILALLAYVQRIADVISPSQLLHAESELYRCLKTNASHQPSGIARLRKRAIENCLNLEDRAGANGER